MAGELLKTIVLSLVRMGAPVPELALSRVQEYRWLRKILIDQRINCVIDVGANRGQSARVFRSLGYRGLIHSFEPHAGSFAALQRRANVDRNWWAHQLALGDEPGTHELHANLTFPEMNSLLEYHHPTDELRPEVVQVQTLDNLFPDVVKDVTEPRVFLKIDTEGYDIRVFRGAKSSLTHIFGLQSELFVAPVFEGAAHYLEALHEFEAAGFKLDHISSVSHTDRGDLMCLNCLMTRGLESQPYAPGRVEPRHADTATSA